MIEVSDRLTFCLNCFRQIDREATRCPFCGIEADRWHETDYVARLSHALEHPLDDVRMRAIIALGWLGEPETSAGGRRPAEPNPPSRMSPSPADGLRDPGRRAKPTARFRAAFHRPASSPP
jgi:hypothetical protein